MKKKIAAGLALAFACALIAQDKGAASSSQMPRRISQSSTSAVAKISTTSNSSGAIDRSRNSNRS